MHLLICFTDVMQPHMFACVYVNPPTPLGSTGCESLAGRLPLIPFILGFRDPDPPGGGRGYLNPAGAFSATGRSRTRSLSISGRHFVDFDFEMDFHWIRASNLVPFQYHVHYFLHAFSKHGFCIHF